MRRYIFLFVNGKPHRVSGTDAFLNLSDFLRHELGLCGTKVMCAEGDCGSCSVLCGRIPPKKPGSSPTIQYVPIDSCIQRLFQLDGCHLITVEGLRENESLTSVQQAMVDCHGSQCGYCTPGFVITMTGILENNSDPNRNDWRHGLTGNLCRCTGYAPILDAGEKSATTASTSLNQIYPSAELIDACRDYSEDPVLIESLATANAKSQVVFAPTSLVDATRFVAANPTARIVAGGTDLGVQVNKQNLEASSWLDLNRIRELSFINTGENQITVGARTTWTELESFARQSIPPLQKIISVFGSPQIRNVGTIGGNIINASPIADSLPFLFVCDAELELASQDGTRTVNINQFYQGYKKMDLQPGEILSRVTIPTSIDFSTVRLYRVSRRRDLDISTFTAAISVACEDEFIQSAAIALGAVGPVVDRLPKTEQFLLGRRFTAETMKLAGEIAIAEITPISDVRGSSNYRFQLARNTLERYYHETCRGETVA